MPNYVNTERDWGANLTNTLAPRYQSWATKKTIKQIFFLKEMINAKIICKTICNYCSSIITIALLQKDNETAQSSGGFISLSKLIFAPKTEAGCCLFHFLTEKGGENFELEDVFYGDSPKNLTQHSCDAPALGNKTCGGVDPCFVAGGS